MQRTLYLKIADFVIKVSSERLPHYPQLWTSVHKYYKGFIVRPNNSIAIDYYIEIINDDTVFGEKNDYVFACISKKVNKNTLHVSYMIGITFFKFIIITLIQDLLYKDGGFYLHASGNIIQGKGILFLAQSGGGKSTISKALGTVYPILGDDSIIIRRVNSTYYCYQTPPSGKERKLTKGMQKYPLSAIYILQKSNKMQCIPVHINMDLPLIVAQLLAKKQYKRTLTKRMFHFLKKFSAVFLLEFTRDKKKALTFFPFNTNSYSSNPLQESN